MSSQPVFAQPLGPLDRRAVRAGGARRRGPRRPVAAMAVRFRGRYRLRARTGRPVGRGAAAGASGACRSPGPAGRDLRLADRQRQAHRGTPRARGRGRGSRGAGAVDARLPAQGSREGTAARRRDEHARRRRPARRRARLHRLPRRQARTEARAAPVLGARARRLELSEILRDGPADRRAPGGARRPAPAGAGRLRSRLRAAHGALARTGRGRGARGARCARRRHRHATAFRAGRARILPRAAVCRAGARQPAHHRARRDQGRASCRAVARGLGSDVRAGRCARGVARESHRWSSIRCSRQRVSTARNRSQPMVRRRRSASGWRRAAS